MQKIAFERFIRKDEERAYFTLPFEVPEGVERLDIRYDYPRRVAREEDGATVVEEINIIDLALTAGNGEYVGASGSDRTHISISAYESAQGYAAVPISPGTWQIIVGAYKVAPEGVTVRYEITLTEKTLRRFQGDTHMHTTGSDGTLSIQSWSICAEAAAGLRHHHRPQQLFRQRPPARARGHDRAARRRMDALQRPRRLSGRAPSLPQPVLRQHARAGARADRGGAGAPARRSSSTTRSAGRSAAGSGALTSRPTTPSKSGTAR